MVDGMKPIPILKKYFGLKDDQNNMDFLQEIKDLKASPDDYKETVELAAAELGVEAVWT